MFLQYPWLADLAIDPWMQQWIRSRWPPLNIKEAAFKSPGDSSKPARRKK